jgi:hypothetical protein
MKNIWITYKWAIIGLIVGGLSGYLYYHFFGCSSGTCAISSNPWISTVYGSVMGTILGIRPSK